MQIFRSMRHGASFPDTPVEMASLLPVEDAAGSAAVDRVQDRIRESQPIDPPACRTFDVIVIRLEEAPPALVDAGRHPIVGAKQHAVLVASQEAGGIARLPAQLVGSGGDIQAA